MSEEINEFLDTVHYQDSETGESEEELFDENQEVEEEE